MNAPQTHRNGPWGPFTAVKLLAVWACVAGVLGAQTLRYEGWDEIRDDRWVHDPDDRPALGFVVRDSSAARNALNEALERLAEGDADAAALAFVDIAEKFSDHVIQVDGGFGRWVGAGELALYMLETAVPASAVAQLDDHAQRDAVANAIAWRDVAELRRLARRWEGQPAGRDATVAIARLLAERGDIQAALMAAERALQLSSSDGDGESSMFVDLVARLRSKIAPAESILVDDEPVRQLTARWQHALTTATLPGLTNGEPDENVFHAAPKTGEAPYAPIHPVVRDGVAYVADTVSVTALNVFSGRVVWHHAGPLELATTQAGYGTGSFTFDVYAHRQRTRAIAPTQIAQPVVTSDMVVATQQVLEVERPTQEFDGVPINWPLPRRRIVALDRFTGKELWRQERVLEGPDAFVNSFDVHGPVVVRGGVVYAAGSVTQGSINAYIAAFDQSNGELLWRTFVCLGQQDLTMFNRPFQEHVTSPPLLHDGSIYMSTNLGVVACVDAWSGRMRWVTGYQQTVRQPSRSHVQNTLRPIHWTNQVPQMGDDVLVIAPLDSKVVLGLDPQTGRTSWTPLSAIRARRGGPYRHQPLVFSSDASDVQDRLLIVGEDTVELFDVTTGVPVRPELFSAVRAVIDTVTAPAVLVGRTLLLPTRSELMTVDVDRWVVGDAVDWPALLWGRRVRRLIPAGMVTLFTDHYEISGALDDERVEKRLMEEAQHSPAAMVTLGEVRLGGGRFTDAIESFAAALEVRDAPESVRKQARGGWIEAALGEARERNSAPAWNELLTVAHAQRRLSVHASEALAALNGLRATAIVDQWVEKLFADVPMTAGHENAQREMLELLVTLDSPRYDGRKAGLARLLGEDAFADALEGKAPAPAEPVAPLLPGADAEVVSLDVDDSSRLFLPLVEGTVDPEYAHLLFAAVSAEGMLVALDAARGDIAWAAKMPGDVRSVNASNAQFITWRDRLVIKAKYELAVLSLADGSRIWSTRFEGSSPLDVVVHSGLVLTLVEDTEQDGVFAVHGFGLQTGVRTSYLEIPGTTSASLFTTGDTLLAFQRRAHSPSVAPERHMLTIDPARGRVLHDTRLSSELEILGEPIDARESVLFKHPMRGDVRWSSWSARTRSVEWTRDLLAGSSVLVAPSGERLTLVTLAVDRTTGNRHDVPVSVEIASGKERSLDGGGMWQMLVGDSRVPNDTLVMLSGEGDVLRVLDGETLDDRAWIDLGEELQGASQVAHGRGGFAIGNVRRSRVDGTKRIDLFVARGADASDRYSHSFETMTSYHPLSIALVDGALVLAQSNRVWMVRDPSVVPTSGDQR